jgi:hypothetical protein
VVEDPKSTRAVADEEAVLGHERAVVASAARRNARRGPDAGSQENAKRRRRDRSPHKNSAYAWDETRPDADHVQSKYRLITLLMKIAASPRQAALRQP